MNNFISILEGIDTSKIPKPQFVGNFKIIDFVKPAIQNHSIEYVDSSIRHIRQEYFCFDSFPQFVCMLEDREYLPLLLNLKTSFVFFEWGDMLLTLKRIDETANNHQYYNYYPHIKIPETFDKPRIWGYQLLQPVIVICKSVLTKEKEGNTLCVQRKHERSDGLIIGGTEWYIEGKGLVKVVNYADF